MGFFSGYVESASVLFQNDLDINLFKVPVEGINLIDISFIHDDECERIIDTDGMVLCTVHNVHGTFPLLSVQR